MGLQYLGIFFITKLIYNSKCPSVRLSICQTFKKFIKKKLSKTNLLFIGENLWNSVALNKEINYVNYFILKEFSLLSAGYHNLYSVLRGLILVLVGGINTSASIHCVLHCCTFQRDNLINRYNNLLILVQFKGIVL